MKNPIQFGLIGAGQIAWPSAESINRHPEARVVAAQDLNRERLEALCKAHNIANRYATAEELFADPQVDAVYIAVPHNLHAIRDRSRSGSDFHFRSALFERLFQGHGRQDGRQPAREHGLAGARRAWLTLGRQDWS